MTKERINLANEPFGPTNGDNNNNDYITLPLKTVLKDGGASITRDWTTYYISNNYYKLKLIHNNQNQNNALS